MTVATDGVFDSGAQTLEVWLEDAGVALGALIDRGKGPMLACSINLSQPAAEGGYVTAPTRFVVVGTLREMARLAASVEEYARRAELVDAYSAALDQMRMWVRGSRQAPS